MNTNPERDNRLILDNPPIRLKRCRRGVMMYLPSDRYMGRALDLYGECVEGEISLFAQLVKPGMTAVDVGAHIGTHTVYFAQAVGPSGHVVAFEPQRFIHQILCGNLALNGLGNVVVYHAGCGDRGGTVAVPALDYAAENNFGGLSLGQVKEGEPVAMVTLDALALAECHFIKIDVEGMEAEVLRGARATLARHHPLLYVENDRQEKSAALIALLFELGYRLYWDIRPLFNAANFAGVSENVFGATVSINMLGVPRSSALVLRDFREITAPSDLWHR